jgi:uncharacterized membrane protein
VTGARIAAARIALAATGAAWGAGAAGLLVGHLRSPHPFTLLAIGAGAGAILAMARPRWPALEHPALAAVAAGAGALMGTLPEPTFFLLVALVAAAVAWPIGPADPEERPVPPWAVPATFALAAAVFFVQSANRHWAFASGSKDLGLFYQTYWLIAHGQPLMNTVMGMHVLADHMTFVDWLFAPLLRLHDDAVTLLLVQAVGVASAVFPLYGLGLRLLGRARWAYTLSWLWLLAPDVHMGVMFDYNQSPLGSAGLLWTAWALVCRGPAAVLVTALFTCFCKGNFCIYVAILALGLAIRVVPWRRAAAVAALAAVIFLTEMLVLSPWFREGGFRHWEFEELGDRPAEIFTRMVTRPDRTAALLVDQPQKRRALLQPLLATGYVGLADPVSLFFQLPNWGERFLSTHRTRWWGYYYGMPAVATALLGLALGWRRLHAAGRAGHRLPWYLVSCALLTGLVPPYKTQDGDRRSMLYTLRRPYAAAPEDVATQRAAVRFIGRDPRLKVAAQYHLLPHLAGRPQVFMLDRAGEADVVALQLNGGTWPEGRPAWRRRVQDLWATGGFHVAFCQGRTVVLFRGAGDSVPCPAWDALIADRREPPPEIAEPEPPLR